MSEGPAWSADSAASRPGVRQGNMASRDAHLMEARRWDGGGRGKVQTLKTCSPTSESF